MLHQSGMVDIDRIAAQTLLNPYDTLGVPRSARLPEAKSAYKKMSLKWHPDRNLNCGKECDDKMAEITKAFDQIKKRQAPVDSDKTWSSWGQDLGRDWWYVLETLTQQWKTRDEEEAQKAARASRKPKPTGDAFKGGNADEQGEKSEL